MTETPLWQRRYRTPTLGFPTWSRHSPDRLVFVSSESGIYQLHGWDVGTGERWQVSREPVGLIHGDITADGEWVVWNQDTTGDESGRLVAAPFRGGTPEPLVEGLPAGWDEGVSLGVRRSAFAISGADGFGLYVAEGSGPARELRRHADSIVMGGANTMVGGGTELAGLSADEDLLCVEHSEHGDLLHPALRVYRLAPDGSATVVRELHDEGRALNAFAWSPIPGDQRLAIGHERRGERAPAIWDMESGAIRDLAVPWDHYTEVADWWPDASAVLLVELLDGRHRLHRYDLATDTLELLETHPGSMTGARIRPDGSVWYRLQNGDHAGVLYEVGRDAPILAPDDQPPGRPFRQWEFTNPRGQRVHGWRVEPEGPKPWPTLVLVHGGPTHLDLDRWAPDVQAYADAGFHVVMVNYRGSIGYGAAWRDTLIGNIGWPEVEDILAGVDDLVADGLADPGRLVIGGWSWGGYITLLMHGMHPDRFVAGVAGVPVGDYAAGYEDLSPILQAYDRALLGGPPSEVPELMKERSPIEYVDRVKAPLLVLAGEHDTRCPLRQVLLYTDRLAARGHRHELYLFPTGHAPYQIDERIHQTGVVLDFLARTVDGIEVPGAEPRSSAPGLTPV
jgi:dipeptidyl aminopeptidase/acylaminoacyl peptidase